MVNLSAAEGALPSPAGRQSKGVPSDKHSTLASTTHTNDRRGTTQDLCNKNARTEQNQKKRHMRRDYH